MAVRKGLMLDLQWLSNKIISFIFSNNHVCLLFSTAVFYNIDIRGGSVGGILDPLSVGYKLRACNSQPIPRFVLCVMQCMQSNSL